MTPLENALTPDFSTSIFHAYHTSHLALVASLPLVGLALANSPTGFFMKVADLSLLLTVPFHAHVGVNMILTDYLNKPVARFATAGLTGLATLGLIKLFLFGPGIINSVTPLFTGKKVDDDE